MDWLLASESHFIYPGSILDSEWKKFSAFKWNIETAYNESIFLKYVIIIRD